MKLPNVSLKQLVITLTLIFVVAGVAVGVTVVVTAPDEVAEFEQQAVGRIQRFNRIIADYITVDKDLDIAGDFTQTGDQTITGDLTVTNDTTFGDAAGDTMNVVGDVVLTGHRDATTGYDYFQTISGDVTGTANGAKTYGLYIALERTANSAHGNIDDSGLKVRYKSSQTQMTAGHVQSGADIEVKNDDNHTASILRGAQITAVSDSGSGTTTQIALRAHAEAEGVVTTTLQVADFELNRKHATDPTNEWGLNIRNTSSAGGAADAALRIASDGSGTDDDWDYAIDMTEAEATTADIRLQNGETIKNTTDTAIIMGGFLALTEGAVVDLVTNTTITPVASYQPLTVQDSAHATTNATTAIANGPVAGTLLILCNEDASYNIVIKDGANTKIGGDITLTANQDDCLSLIWNGADWVGLSDMDN